MKKIELVLLVLVSIILTTVSQIPLSTVNWIQQTGRVSTTKFSNRNAHASCVFKGKIWVTGGRTVLYNQYNLLPSVKTADVWYTSNGADWFQQGQLAGDFYAQNADAMQPGDLAPWFPRFGHQLNALSGTVYNLAGDVMMLTGGYSPQPSNDIWITPDGNTWYYAGTTSIKNTYSILRQMYICVYIYI
jgi:hypothetical protein